MTLYRLGQDLTMGDPGKGHTWALCPFLKLHGTYIYLKIISLINIFIFMIIINPYVIYSYGFILSFLVSFTMIVNNELFTGNSLMKSIKSYIIIFLSVLPIIVNMTNKISIIWRSF